MGDQVVEGAHLWGRGSRSKRIACEVWRTRTSLTSFRLCCYVDFRIRVYDCEELMAVIVPPTVHACEGNTVLVGIDGDLKRVYAPRAFVNSRWSRLARETGIDNSDSRSAPVSPYLRAFAYSSLLYPLTRRRSPGQATTKECFSDARYPWVQFPVSAERLICARSHTSKQQVMLADLLHPLIEPG